MWNHIINLMEKPTRRPHRNGIQFYNGVLNLALWVLLVYRTIEATKFCVWYNHKWWFYVDLHNLCTLNLAEKFQLKFSWDFRENFQQKVQKA